MRRIKGGWLEAYISYAARGEAPILFHHFCGVSAVAGALRRKVWLDMYYYRWMPSFYIILVAPPGIVSKSSTADLAMKLLREVPGINFGPDIVTWPALVGAFEGAAEMFEHEGDFHPMSALTLSASELGNLITPQDRDQINLYITLWDCLKSLSKVTKMSGSNAIEAPWINILGCTTPHWLADNLPSVSVGGGFTSRCIFVYAEKKERLIAYPSPPAGVEKLRADLIHDLEWISMNITGEYHLEREAIVWGEEWYHKVWTGTRPRHLQDDRLDGYVSRKQTHLHKLAMVNAASQRDELVITKEDLVRADFMLGEAEQSLPKVFSKMGKSETALEWDRILSQIKYRGKVTYMEAARLLIAQYPDGEALGRIIKGAIDAGYLRFYSENGVQMLAWIDQ